MQHPAELNNDEPANIILFLTHHSNDASLINELAERAELIFTEIDDISLDEDLSTIDELVANFSTLGTKDRKLKETAVQYSNREDQIREFNFQKMRRSYNESLNMMRIARQLVANNL